jgi:hypothetical protein
MRKPVPRVITCSLLLYRWLLTLAPEEFSDTYTDPALQVFRQCCWDAYQQRGMRGVLCLWLPTFADALYSVLAEQGAGLRQVFCSRLTWPVVLALGCVLFPFYWLSRTWGLFGRLFHSIFATPQAYIAGHIMLFCVAGLIMLCSLPALQKHLQLYVLCLMLGAFAEEVIQILFNAHPGLHKDAHTLLLDLCGIVLAALLLRVWQNQRRVSKRMSNRTPCS